MERDLPAQMPSRAAAAVPTTAPQWLGPPAQYRPSPGQQNRVDVRVGDAERGLVCEQLSAAFAAGRLDETELEDRLACAMAARTRQQLTLLVHDLGPARTGTPPTSATPVPAVPSWQGTDILAVLLLIGSTVSVLGMLLLISGVSATWFFCSVLGGSLAFVAGASACQLLHRVTRHARQSARPV